MHWIHDDIAVSGLYDLHFGEPVSAVLNVCEWRPYELPDGVAYLHRGFPDVQPFPIETVWDCVRWLDRQLSRGGKALVHCAEGNSRSVTVAVSYVMFKGEPLERIKREVIRRKPFTQFSGIATFEPQYFQDAFLARWSGLLDVRLRKDEDPVANQS